MYLLNICYGTTSIMTTTNYTNQIIVIVILISSGHFQRCHYAASTCWIMASVLLWIIHISLVSPICCTSLRCQVSKHLTTSQKCGLTDFISGQNCGFHSFWVLNVVYICGGNNILIQTEGSIFKPCECTHSARWVEEAPELPIWRWPLRCHYCRSGSLGSTLTRRACFLWITGL